MAVEIRIQYCTAWNYLPKAAGLAEKLLSDYKQGLAGLTLVPGSGGCFEVSVDGDLVFSKLREGRFPEYGEITAHL